MKISTKNVLLMFYFKFQLEIFLSSIHDYHKLVSLFSPGTSYVQQTSQYTKCPPQSLS
jgi:hypothetical protein